MPLPVGLFWARAGSSRRYSEPLGALLQWVFEIAVPPKPHLRVNLRDSKKQIVQVQVYVQG